MGTATSNAAQARRHRPLVGGGPASAAAAASVDRGAASGGTHNTWPGPGGSRDDKDGSGSSVASGGGVVRYESGGTITTVAGNGSMTHLDGQGTQNSAFHYPCGLLVDASRGRLYVADQLNHCIRVVDQNGVVSTFVGSGVEGRRDGVGRAAQLSCPAFLFRDRLNPSKGDFFCSEAYGRRIVRITADAEVSMVVGSLESGIEAPAHGALFANPRGLVQDSLGRLIVSSSGDSLVRMVHPDGYIHTFCGSTVGHSDGLGSAAQFQYPDDMTIDQRADILYLSDWGNHRICRITISTQLVMGAIRQTPGLASMPSHIHQLIAEYDPPQGIVTTLVGGLGRGNEDGSRSVARLASPTGIVMDQEGNDGSGTATGQSGALYVCNEFAIRKIVLSTGKQFLELVAALRRCDHLCDFPPGLLPIIASYYPLDAYVTTVAGGAEAGRVDGVGAQARFARLSAIAIMPSSSSTHHHSHTPATSTEIAPPPPPPLHPSASTPSLSIAVPTISSSMSYSDGFASSSSSSMQWRTNRHHRRRSSVTAPSWRTRCVPSSSAPPSPTSPVRYLYVSDADNHQVRRVALF